MIWHESEIQTLSIHYVGNKANEESLIISEQSVEMNDILKEHLRDFFSTAISKRAH